MWLKSCNRLAQPHHVSTQAPSQTCSNKSCCRQQLFFVAASSSGSQIGSGGSTSRNRSLSCKRQQNQRQSKRRISTRRCAGEGSDERAAPAQVWRHPQPLVGSQMRQTAHSRGHYSPRLEFHSSLRGAREPKPEPEVCLCVAYAQLTRSLRATCMQRARQARRATACANAYAQLTRNEMLLTHGS
jgi:hypothetical protein